MTPNDIHAIGYVAQGLFSSRFIIQWISSEKAGKVLAPTLFWQISLIASFMLIVYGILVKDITILLGQSLGYYIYVRNLRLQNSWRILPRYFRYLVIAVPIVALAILFFGEEYSFKNILEGHSSNLILFWGTIGQLVFSCRFIYQWYYSEKVKKSVLPLGFWILSIVGSLIISSYSYYLSLYPIIIGHLFGLVIYSRNIMIYFKGKR
ncbi:MAG: lipid-A-disaccharide synthase N-terminal domain-containing protein [Vicingaceae bacterium]|jgi:lipid-A-disaccharide synthase-like uncharacterized protein|tara:strand:- start:2971 stop:3591 length:621 start_codon:yes stop_codon:yes gene_type:complete